MRNLLRVGMVLVLVFVMSQVFAQTSVTIGGSYWKGTIEETVFDETYSNSANMFGPYVNFRQGKFSLGLSYFSGTYDYSDDLTEIYEASWLGDYGFVPDADITYEVKRKDLNVSVGYALNRNVSLFGAYKSITSEDNMTIEFSNAMLSQPAPIDTSDTGAFVGGGASLRLPFGSSMFLFGSAAYLVSQDEDWNDLTSVAFGVGAYTRSGISVLVGYRLDTFLGSSEDEGDMDIKGIMATIAYTIRTK